MKSWVAPAGMAAFLLLIFTAPLMAEPPPVPVEELGDGHYRVGQIEVDKNARRFSVAGTVIGLEPDMPVEFLVIAQDGPKAYESLVEVETGALEFNFACILIGLDADIANRPKYHFDETPIDGDEVAIRISWLQDGKDHDLEIGQLLKGGGAEAGEHRWIYTGSFFDPSGAYAAAMTGTLVGVVHDPESIIQHSTGLGLGDYGAVTWNPDTLPPPLTPVTITVTAKGGAGQP